MRGSEIALFLKDSRLVGGSHISLIPVCYYFRKSLIYIMPPRASGARRGRRKATLLTSTQGARHEHREAIRAVHAIPGWGHHLCERPRPRERPRHTEYPRGNGVRQPRRGPTLPRPA